MEKINVDKFKRLPWSEKNTLLEGFLLTGKYEDALECLPTELKCFIFFAYRESISLL